MSNLKGIKPFLLGGASIIAALALVYLVMWCGTSTIYNIFYEDMVKATIAEMVKPGALR